MGKGGPAVADLDEAVATRPGVAGAKAAALARGRAAGLPVLPGFVLTPGAVAPVLRDPAVRSAWGRLSDDGARPLVVRSSSSTEDGATSSMAGVFESVLDVVGEREFEEAVARVRESAVANVVALSGAASMQVLVQPMLPATRGGVLFGVDPVSGRRDRFVVAVVEGGPERLVQGQDSGAVLELTRRGRLVGDAAAVLDRSERVALARLARRAERLFGGPQDIEWAVDVDGRLWLLQSRPVTAAASRPARGSRRLGPGPVAETFPAPLSPLEEDLWVEPLRRGLRHALLLAGAAPRRRIDASPLVTLVGGRVAADLDLLEPEPARGWRRLDPRPHVRRLAVAWRVGRLRAALPLLGRDLVDRVDLDLAAVPRLDTLGNEELTGLLGRLGDGLTAVHGHEVLEGLLLPGDAGGATAAGLALRSLSYHRARGLGDEEIVARDPVVLALVPPRVGPRPLLPDVPAELPPAPPAGPEAAAVREALRVRARWLQELGARAAWELGSRLFDQPDRVRSLRLADLVAAAAGHLEVVGAAFGGDAPGPPLPSSFRLAPDGTVVAESPSPAGAAGGRGAGGGRGGGVVHHDPATVPAGAVLVVATLDPELAPVLPSLGGLVAETGSVLSHLAILARELGVPTVVGVRAARERFRAGATVLVDGTTGEVAEAATGEVVVA